MPASPTVSVDVSAIDNRAPNVGRQFFDRVQATPDREAYRYPVADRWESQTWRETGEQVTRLAAGLGGLGGPPEQRGGIAPRTRLEGILADLALMSAGGPAPTRPPPPHTPPPPPNPPGPG